MKIGVIGDDFTGSATSPTRLPRPALARSNMSVVAGGETSDAVASAFGPHAPEIDSGVPVLIRNGEPRLAFALKSGNFGGDEFFARAVGMLKGGAT
jgi:uncharacterized protein YgbK (DUF1537 family)